MNQNQHVIGLALAAFISLATLSTADELVRCESWYITVSGTFETPEEAYDSLGDYMLSTNDSEIMDEATDQFNWLDATEDPFEDQAEEDIEVNGSSLSRTTRYFYAQHGIVVGLMR